MILQAVKLAHGAVSTRELLPMLTHFCIYDGRVQGANGRLAIDVACPELAHLNVTVPADRFVKAIERCTTNPTVEVDGGSLAIRSGRLRVKLPVLPVDQYPRADLMDAGTPATFDTFFLATLNRLRGFVSQDASRPWSQGVLFADGRAWATNNTILAWVDSGVASHSFTLPVDTIDELLRIGQEPDVIQVYAGAVAFLFGDNWLKSHLLAAPWPDVATMVDNAWSPRGMVRIRDDLHEAVVTVKDFAPDPKFPLIVLEGDRVSTDQGVHSAQVDGFDNLKGSYRAEPLMQVLEHATHIDFSQYPRPVPWQGDGIRGLLVGVVPT